LGKPQARRLNTKKRLPSKSQLEISHYRQAVYTKVFIETGKIISMMKEKQIGTVCEERKKARHGSKKPRQRQKRTDD
jgi:hypothetical protein